LLERATSGDSQITAPEKLGFGGDVHHGGEPASNGEANLARL
jgi:hypothetical protein